MTSNVLAELAPTGVLRAGINLSNFLLVSSRGADGAPAGVAPGILERLTREPVTTRADSGGHGMGLVFCRRVLQAVGGSIDIQSEPGQGCHVTLVFQNIEDTGT